MDDFGAEPEGMKTTTKPQQGGQRRGVGGQAHLIQTASAQVYYSLTTSLSSTVSLSLTATRH